MGEVEEVQEQIEAGMEALKEQMASMMEAMMSVKVKQRDVHNMAISTNNHIANAYMKFRLYAWQCLKGTQHVHFVPLF